MVERKTIGRLTCDYATAGCARVCYLLSPLPVSGEEIGHWAEHYGGTMVVVRGFDWDNDLTPWPAPGVLPGDAAFRGDAEALLAVLRRRVLPEVESGLDLSPSFVRDLAGVSLSGLFAVWAWMQGDDFRNIGSISGSFWYDGFTDWLAREGAVQKPGYAYFSLGDREGVVGNPRYRTVQKDTARVVGTLQGLGIRAFFEPTRGTHFAPFAPRMEKLLQGFARLEAGE